MKAVPVIEAINTHNERLLEDSANRPERRGAAKRSHTSSFISVGIITRLCQVPKPDICLRVDPGYTCP